MTVPTLLQDWTLSVVETLLRQGFHEAESFDFKEQLPHSKDDEGKRGLRQACAAFANSGGGFFVYGVKDKGTDWQSRLIGLPAAVDFPGQFGTFPAACNPSVAWDFTNPGLSLSNGNLIYVVEILRSHGRPHTVQGEKAPLALLFPKRTNKGTEFMSYSEIKAQFLHHYEKVMQLQHLRGELEHAITVVNQIERELDGASRTPGTPGIPGIVFSRFDVSIIEQVTSNVFTAIFDQEELLRMLRDVRDRCRRANNVIDYAYRVLPLGDLGRYNSQILGVAQEVIHPARRAQRLLDDLEVLRK